MELVKVLKKLQGIYEHYGNCEVLMFDIHTLSSKPISVIKYLTEKDFRDDLKDEPSYVENFNKELNNVTIL